MYIYPCQWFIASWDDVGRQPKRIWTLTEINNINKYIMSGTGHLTSGVNFTWSGARWSMSVHPLRLTVSHASLVFIGACWFVDHQMICTCIYKIYQNLKYYYFFIFIFFQLLTRWGLFWIYCDKPDSTISKKYYVWCLSELFDWKVPDS